MLEFLAAAVLQDHLALLVRALVFLAPFFVLLDVGKKDQLFAIVARDLEDLDELLKDVRAWTDSELARALEGAVLLPLRDTAFAEELPAIIAFHRVDRNLEANSTNKGVFKLLMHLAIEDPLNVISSLVVGLLLVSEIFLLR